MIKLLHISDIHIGAKLSFLEDKAKEHRERIWGSLENAINLAKSEKVQAVIFTGDTFDHYYPSKENIDRFHKLISDLGQNSIYSIILPGNHDRLEQGSVWEEFQINKASPNEKQYIKVFKGKNTQFSLPEIDLDVFANPIFTQQSKTSPLKGLKELVANNSKSKYKVVLAHGNLNLDNKKKSNFPIEKQGIIELAEVGVHYVALGEWHGTFDATQKTNDGKQITAYYAGSPEILDKSQKNARNCLLVEFGDNAQTKVEIRNVSNLKLETKEINLNQLGADSIYKEIESLQNKNLILSVKITGNLPLETSDKLNLDDIFDKLKSKFYHLEIKNQLNLTVDNKDLEKYPEGSIPHEFIKLVSQHVKDKKLNPDTAQEVTQLGIRTINQKQ
jgi:DNA repair exonuclease SbcCD nuclease subunit